ncbi:MAG: 2-hydroxyglutaryl-CoA dehydratase [Deltaproteobacteria bacterium]|nr:2-hydroxyglutaryl-CoA dehydratase [Deltaproteobacteria bacterium]
MTIQGLGLDVGSTAVKLVAVDEEGGMLRRLVEPTEPRLEAQTTRLIEQARKDWAAGEAPLVATGYGRKLVSEAKKQITEITCHAKGIFGALGRAGTIVDIGGQDAKVIVIGDKGAVENFVMNDKCAAGTGRFLEVTANRLRLDVEQMGKLALVGTAEVPISSTCVVFAESEIVSLIARGTNLEPIVRGLHRSLVGRVVSLARSAGFAPPLMLSGGVAKNEAVRRFFGEAMQCEVLMPEHPQFMGAYGAALLAGSL